MSNGYTTILPVAPHIKHGLVTSDGASTVPGGRGLLLSSSYLPGAFVKAAGLRLSKLK